MDPNRQFMTLWAQLLQVNLHANMVDDNIWNLTLVNNTHLNPNVRLNFLGNITH
jgi:hypothetical protein